MCPQLYSAGRDRATLRTVGIPTPAPNVPLRLLTLNEAQIWSACFFRVCHQHIVIRNTALRRFWLIPLRWDVTALASLASLSPTDFRSQVSEISFPLTKKYRESSLRRTQTRARRRSCDCLATASQAPNARALRSARSAGSAGSAMQGSRERRLNSSTSPELSVADPADPADPADLSALAWRASPATPDVACAVACAVAWAVACAAACARRSPSRVGPCLRCGLACAAVLRCGLG